MALLFGSMRRDFWQTFDQLAGTPKPRRAVASFIMLSLVTTLCVISISLYLQSYLAPLGVTLSNTLSFNISGILARPSFWGFLYVAVVGIIWTQVMFYVRKLAFKIGGESEVKAQ